MILIQRPNNDEKWNNFGARCNFFFKSLFQASLFNFLLYLAQHNIICEHLERSLFAEMRDSQLLSVATNLATWKA